MAFSPLRKLLPACALIVLAGLPLALLTLGGGHAGRAPGGYASVDTAVGKRFVRSQAPPAHTHSGSLGVPGMSEKELRAFETAVLGPAHAREHALLRKAARRGELPDERSPSPARRRGRRPGRRRPLDGAVLDPGDGRARGRAPDRQGHVVLVSEEPERPARRRRPRVSEHGAGVAVGSGHRPADTAWTRRCGATPRTVS